MKQVRLAVSLTLVGPVLTRSTAAGKLGIDASAARNSEDRCVLPFSLVKGRVRQSWEEIGLPDIDRLFGNRRGGWRASRGALRFSDFVERGSGTTGRRLHRIRIDSGTGAAKDGALLVIEGPFAPGEAVTFEGDVSFFARDEAETRATAESIEHAFRWSPSFGAERTTGFGRVQAVDFEVHAQDVSSSVALPNPTATTYDLEIVLHDPLCLARRRIDENFFESDDVIPGSVLRGVIATTLNRLLGREPASKIDRGAAAGTPWEALGAHFNEIRLTHSFPTDGGARPCVPPLTIVHADGRFADVALADGPALIDGKAPELAIDWKKEVAQQFVSTPFGAPFKRPEIRREVRVRTAIDRITSRSADAQLFGHELLDPSGIVWRGSADFSRIGAGERAQVVEQLVAVMATIPAAFGKTKARGTVKWIPRESPAPEPSFESDGAWVVTLQTPALLCDPERLDETSGREDLFRAYADAWDDISSGALRLERFFASQSLAGGYLVHRFQHDRPYRPFLLTDAGSVFVLRPVSDERRAAVLKERTLPLPQWARDRYGDSWETNPFLPDDGFGEIAVNLSCHRDRSCAELHSIDTPAFAQPAWEKTPAPEQPEIDRQETVRSPDEEISRPAMATVVNRWRITGRLTTRTDFHLGNGDVSTRPDRQLARDDEDGKRVDVKFAAVATAFNGRPYIPGSSLKGALRSWLAQQRLDPTLVNAVFGDEDTSKKDGRAGKAEFHDALVADPESVSGSSVPYWSPERLTGVTASAAIDRWTRTARDKKLMHREYVPSGVSFSVVVTGQNLLDEEVVLLLYVFRMFNEQEHSLALGSETREGWGRFDWQVSSVATLDGTNREAVARHVAKAPATLDGFEQKDIRDLESAIGAVSSQIQPADVITIPVTIEFDGPFLVNEPSRTKKSKDRDNDLPNHAARLDRDGRVALPVSAVRGALRAQAEKILRTLEKTREPKADRVSSACHCTDENDACPAIEDAGQKRNLCLACQVFGAAGWASAISFSTPNLVGRPIEFRQELVAIDRFTGGSADTAKFNVDAYWRPAFEMTITIDRARCGGAGAGLVALVLRDLAEGDIVLGFGASKGFGNCTARVAWPADSTDHAAALHALVGVSAMDADPDRLQAAEPVRKGADARPANVSAPLPNDDRFFNPYHFVPIIGDRKHDIAVWDFDEHRPAHLFFDRYADNTLSGRLVCRLTTLTPLVIGASQEQPDPSTIKVVEPFVEPETQKPMIPASSLRGLISSVAEAATNSALRVLENRSFSVRRGMSESLQAIGMIVDTRAGKRLRPLTLPALPDGIVPPEYRGLFPSPVLKVYVDGYRPKRGAAPPMLEATPGSFLARLDPVSYSADHREHWYLDLSGSTCTIDQRTSRVTASHPHETRTGREQERRWLLGMRVTAGDKDAVPVDETTYRALSPSEQERYTCGILRVLGIEGREDDMPMTKKHEIFIPYDPKMPLPTLLDATDAIAEFERMAAERTEDDQALPFELRGSQRSVNPAKSKKIEMRDGDIVCFEPAAGGKKVAHVSVSSIWRRQVDGTAHQFFPPEWVPFNPTRTTISIGEQMFGFVEGMAKGKGRSRALASRIRFSAALLGRLPDGETTPFLPAVPLKILSSPKPPSPAFYFRHKGIAARSIRKSELTTTQHVPQGRKFYLHHRENITPEPWCTANDAEHAGQKARVTPVRGGAEFFFHIDFENLTRDELEILCYAVRPTAEFRHKLGMGKPIGLGSVTIDPAGLFLIDRRRRYERASTESLTRYDECWLDPDVMNAAPARYEREQSAATGTARRAALLFDNLVGGFRKSKTVQTEALEILGNPDNIVHPVHTPQIDGAASLEKDTFQWFVRNEDRHFEAQLLIPLDRQHELSALSRGFKDAVRGGGPPQRQGRPVNRRPPATARPPAELRQGRIVRGEGVTAPVETWSAATLTYDAAHKLIIATHASETKKKAQLKETEAHRSLVQRIRKSGWIAQDLKAQRTGAGNYEIVDLDI